MCICSLNSSSSHGIPGSLAVHALWCHQRGAVHVKEAWRAGLKGGREERMLVELWGNWGTEESLCLGTGWKVMFTPSIVPVRSELTCESAFVWQMLSQTHLVGCSIWEIYRNACSIPMWHLFNNNTSLDLNYTLEFKTNSMLAYRFLGDMFKVQCFR